MNPALSQYWLLEAGFVLVAAVIAGLTWAAAFLGTNRIATKGQNRIVGLGFLPSPATVLFGLCFAHLPGASVEIHPLGAGLAYLACLMLIFVQLATPFLLWRTIPSQTIGEAWRSFAVLVFGAVAVIVDLAAILTAAQLLAGVSL